MDTQPLGGVALLAAGQAVEAARPGFTRDLAEALRGWPGIGPEAAQPAGQRQRVKLIGAAERVQEERLELEHRARAAVRGWDRLERAHDQAARAYDRMRPGRRRASWRRMRAS